MNVLVFVVVVVVVVVFGGGLGAFHLLIVSKLSTKIYLHTKSSLNIVHSFVCFRCVV